jgi:uncharacterized peroxidase-related enzyme
VLLYLYPGEGVATQIVEDFERAPIPDLHKTMFRWVKRFAHQSWKMTEYDTQTLRDAGLPDAEIVNWAQIACLQTWWVMSADGGGIPLEENAVVGPAIGLKRESYHSSEEGLTAANLGEGSILTNPPKNGIAWVETDEGSDDYNKTATWAENRYGFIPNLLKAVSLRPENNPSHTLAMELLEKPQSSSLTPRQHAMVRALVSCLNRCNYFRETTQNFLEKKSNETDLYERLTNDYTEGGWEPTERVILNFAAKLTRNAYKVTEKDAESFRKVGLDDEAYVDVLNTTSIQTTLDRIANSLGVVPDSEPILPL